MSRLIAVLCALMLLAGCSSAPSSSAAPRREPKPVASSSQGSSTGPSSGETAPESVPTPTKDDLPIDIDGIALEKWIEGPTKISNARLTATYTNNTDATIKSITFEVLLKDTNEVAYLSDSTTVLPGETSPNFECKAPKTANMEDVQILTCDITIQNDDGTSTYVTFDNKLHTLEWYTM